MAHFFTRNVRVESVGAGTDGISGQDSAKAAFAKEEMGSFAPIKGAEILGELVRILAGRVPYDLEKLVTLHDALCPRAVASKPVVSRHVSPLLEDLVWVLFEEALSEGGFLLTGSKKYISSAVSKKYISSTGSLIS